MAWKSWPSCSPTSTRQGTALHGSDRRPPPGVDVGGRPFRPVEPHAQVELDRFVQVAAGERLVLGVAEPSNLGRPVVTDHARAHENQAGHEGGLGGGNLEGDTAPHRTGHEDRSVNTERGAQGQDVGAVAEGLGRQRGPAEAA